MKSDWSVKTQSSASLLDRGEGRSTLDWWEMRLTEEESMNTEAQSSSWDILSGRRGGTGGPRTTCPGGQL